MDISHSRWGSGLQPAEEPWKEREGRKVCAREGKLVALGGETWVGWLGGRLDAGGTIDIN